MYCNYLVVTAACHRAPRYKLLITKKKKKGVDVTMDKNKRDME